MKTYLVGGAVRDALLGRPFTERDYVVVGARPDDLLALGYRPVGKDFPVFLHPQTGDQYALARTERKTGAGYYGFATRFSPDVTLEEDLARRDLTINAMAQSVDGDDVIDPYGGRRDLAARVLRHVSPAFVEDPLRVLRVARFAARFAPLGFTIAPETLQLMRDIVRSGEMQALVAERVWVETERALGERMPTVYFEVLRECGALAVLLPELDCLFGVPQPEKWHPEIDTGIHTLQVLDVACELSNETTVRFAALVHDLGKGVTPRDQWPSHVGHEQAGVRIIARLCERLRVPTEHRELGQLVSSEHQRIHRAAELRDTTVLEVLEAADAFRRPERFDKALLACEADARGRGPELRAQSYPQAQTLRECLRAAAAVKLDPEAMSQLAGPAIAAAIRRARVEAIRTVRGS
ncbi:MAG: multifunctional CCA addition/repair protein [Gammaproteobacteria bacterium]|nr:multifunctional CCA addition/repair protein [Gammaproteobacteria bacterium]MDH4310860.1 multifunctional CCA addition/repair protein [Gammaproteobacteria bacterium]MDH5272271.1 multifunctional CCA addition/repair protein [Gammaproteobacteria bacterium]